MRLDHPTCYKLLQHLEQEGLYDQVLSNLGYKFYIYGRTDSTRHQKNSAEEWVQANSDPCLSFISFHTDCLSHSLQFKHICVLYSLGNFE